MFMEAGQRLMSLGVQSHKSGIAVERFAIELQSGTGLLANLLLCECGRDALQNFGASIITVVGNPNPPVARKSLGCGKHYNSSQ